MTRDYSGQNNPHWKGGMRMQEGYVEVFKPGHPRAHVGGYVKRSIDNWEKANGVPFPEGKEPHHINGIKTDDRPENILPVTHGEHSSIQPRFSKVNQERRNAKT